MARSMVSDFYNISIWRIKGMAGSLWRGNKLEDRRKGGKIWVYQTQHTHLLVFLPFCSRSQPFWCTDQFMKLLRDRQFFHWRQHFYHCGPIECIRLLDGEKCDWKVISGFEMVERFRLERKGNLEIRQSWKRVCRKFCRLLVLLD